MWCSVVGRVGVVQRGGEGRCDAAWWGGYVWCSVVGRVIVVQRGGEGRCSAAWWGG